METDTLNKTDLDEREEENEQKEQEERDEEMDSLRNSKEFRAHKQALEETIGDALPNIVEEKLDGVKRSLLATMQAERDLAGDTITDEMKSNFLHDLRKKREIENGTIDAKCLQSESDYYKRDAVSENTEGTNLVPKPLFNEIGRIAREFGIIERDAMRIPMTTLMQDFPIYTQALLLGAFRENDTGDMTAQTDPTFSKVTFLVKTWYNLIGGISKELLADTNTRMYDLIIAIIGEGYAARKDKEGFAGTGSGTSPFTGILNDTTISSLSLAATKTKTADATINDLLDLKDQVEENVVARGAYFMHRTMWTHFRRAQNANNYILGTNETAVLRSQFTGALMPVGFFDDRPVYTSRYLPALSNTADTNKDFVIFADLSRLIGNGDRQDMQILTSEHAQIGTRSMFTHQEIAVLPLARYALKTYLAAAGVKLKTAAS